MTYLKTTAPQIVSSPTGGAAIVRVPTNSRGEVTPGDIEGDVEIWYYRQDRVPKGVPFQELRYRFISKKGYGTEVLQRDNIVLTTIDAAKNAGRSGVLARKAEK